MREVVIGDTDLLECDKCHAVWVDADTFEHICASHETQAAVLHQWPTPPPSQAAAVHYRRCVACGQIMNRMNFGRLSGTIVDVCKGHGTMLDAGELHQIVTFIQGGGLDRARQRQIEDLKDAEAQLRASQQAQATREISGSGVSMSFSTSRWQGPDLLDILKRLSKDS